MTSLFRAKMLKCPDCAGYMEAVSVSGLDESFRCFNCGGVWARAKMVNRLFTEELARWRPAQVDPTILGFGNHKCPTDELPLKLFTGKQVPQDLPVWRCEKCKWWWWPGDSLFRFKPFQEERIRRAKAEGTMASLAASMLPLVGLVVLMTGLGVGLSLVGRRQQAAVPAASQVRDFAVVYLGQGVEMISFVSPVPVSSVEYQRVGDGQWSVVEAVAQGDRYTARIDGLLENEEYAVRILGRVYKFGTR